MFDKFTDRARKIIALAQKEAERFRHDYIGTEHLLLGLVKEGSGVAVTALNNLSVDVEKVRREVEKLVVIADKPAPSGPLPFTPQAKRVLELASEEARGWLRPFWDRVADMNVEERGSVAEALAGAVAGIGPEWLPRLESASQALPRDGAVALAAGRALAERGLWGKARALLELAGGDASLGTSARRKAWLALAELATREGDAARAAQCFETAARVA